MIVLIFHGVIERLFTLSALPYAFIGAGIYLWLPTMLGWWQKKSPVVKNGYDWRSAVAMGVAQGIAVVPGLSRSGLTITTGRLTGMSATEATDFSFLMSIPIIVASLLYELLHGGNIQTLGISNIVLAFVAAFIAGIVAIKMMLEITRKIDLRWFAYYLLLLGAGLLITRWC